MIGFYNELRLFEAANTAIEGLASMNIPLTSIYVKNKKLRRV